MDKGNFISPVKNSLRNFERTNLLRKPFLHFLLPLSVLGKIAADDILKFFSYFSKKKGFDISCNGDNLHEMSNPVFLEK